MKWCRIQNGRVLKSKAAAKSVAKARNAMPEVCCCSEARGHSCTHEKLKFQLILNIAVAQPSICLFGRINCLFELFGFVAQMTQIEKILALGSVKEHRYFCMIGLNTTG